MWLKYFLSVLFSFFYRGFEVLRKLKLNRVHSLTQSLSTQYSKNIVRIIERARRKRCALSREFCVKKEREKEVFIRPGGIRKMLQLKAKKKKKKEKYLLLLLLGKHKGKKNLTGNVCCGGFPISREYVYTEQTKMSNCLWVQKAGSFL